MSSIYLVYRNHYKGPLSKSIAVLEGNTILEWFQWAWAEAKRAYRANVHAPKLAFWISAMVLIRRFMEGKGARAGQ